MNSPKSALLIPCYNAERFLPMFIEEIRALDPGFDEVLLYDDASTDQTASIARKMGLTIIQGDKNLGPGGARNVLAANTNAEWIHFHDVDDEIAPDYLYHVLPHLTGDIDLVLHDVEFIEEGTRAHIITFHARPEIETDPIRSLLVNPMGTWSSVIRREFFLDSGGFDGSYRCFEDGDMHLRLALAGARILRLPMVLETSLRHGDGASADMTYCYRCRFAFLERYVDILPERLMDDLSSEFSKTAYALIKHGDFELAKRSIDSCRAIGGSFPRTKNKLLSFLSMFLPDVCTILIQESVRRGLGRLQAKQILKR